jgi:hypothetical protein
MKKKILLSIAALTVTAIVTGCGSSGGSNNGSSNSTSNSTSNNKNNQSTQTKTVKVIDGYVIGSHVCDASGICADTNENGIAAQSFANTVLTAKSGYIDVNGNHQIDDSDINLPNDFTLKTPAGKTIITPITDLIANGADPVKLAKTLGINVNDLYTDPIATNNVELAKIFQMIYIAKTTNKETELVNKINSYEENTVAENTQAKTPSELPLLDDNASIPTTSSNNVEKKESNDTELPLIGKAADAAPPSVINLDSVDTTDNTSDSNESNTDTTKNSNTVTLDVKVDVFESLLLSIIDDENIKSVIKQIAESNVTNPLELEQSIVEVNKQSATNFKNISKNNEKNETQNVESSSTPPSQPIVENVENNSTESNNKENTNLTQEEENTTTTSENNTTTSLSTNNSELSELPPF